MSSSQRSGRSLINDIEFGWSHKLFLAASIANHHTIIALGSFQRYITIDDIVQHQLDRALEGIAIATTTGQVELNMDIRCQSSHRLWLRTGLTVQQKLAGRSLPPMNQTGRGKMDAIGHRRNRPGGRAALSHLRPLS